MDYEPDAFLEQQYEDRFYIPDDDLDFEELSEEPNMCENCDAICAGQFCYLCD